MGLGALAYGLQKGMDDAEALRRARAMEDFNMAQSKRALEMREQAFPLALEQAQTANALSRQRLEEEQAAAPQRQIQLAIQTREMQANEAVAQRSRQLQKMLVGAHVMGRGGDLSGYENFFDELAKDYGGGTTKFSEGADEDGVPSILATTTRPNGTSYTRTIRAEPSRGLNTPLDALGRDALYSSSAENLLSVANRREEEARKRDEEDRKLAGQKALKDIEGKNKMEQIRALVTGRRDVADVTATRRNEQQDTRNAAELSKNVKGRIEAKPELREMMKHVTMRPLQTFIEKRGLNLMRSQNLDPAVAGGQAFDSVKAEFNMGLEAIEALPHAEKNQRAFLAGMDKLMDRYIALGWDELSWKYLEKKGIERNLKAKR